MSSNPDPASHHDTYLGDPSRFERFNALLGTLNYPMFIVTATDGTRRAGCLVGFGGQCSIEPARFMVWLSTKNYTRAVVQAADRLAVHIPTAGKRDLAVLFGSLSGFTVDKFSRCEWREGPGGIPLLVDCPQWFIGRIVHRYDTGDHDGILLEPTHVTDNLGLGQLDFDAVRDVEAGNDA
jgi:flavin reductase (DIM6/NTAB) family NADH-FMN oxidoreductase RutF